MKKGFTLIELLGVIILLGLIGLIVIPSITKLLKDSRQNLYENQVKMIEDNARKWGLQNDDKLSETEATYISLNNLIDAGYIEQDAIKYPRKSEDMNGCIVVEYDSKTSKFKYKYNDSECSGVADSSNMTASNPQYMCYNFDETTGTIMKYDVNNTNCLTDVIIPDKIDGVTVKHIGNAAFVNGNGQQCYNDGDSGISVPDNYVRSEGDGYIGCYFDYNESNIYITSVTFPKYLESIGTSSFVNHFITSLDFSNSPNLTKINDDAFYDNLIEAINFTNSTKLEYIGAWTFGENPIMSMDFTSLNNLKYIGNFAFISNNIYSITIPASVTDIGYHAFYDNPIIIVIIEGDDKYRFNSTWVEIGFPSSLKPTTEITEVSKTLSTSSPTEFLFEYAYYRVTVPVTGNYQFEVWGAQGGNVFGEETVYGGKGAYSSGNYYLTADQIIYVYVGGAGESISNGGGCGGGGASEIRTSNALTTPLTASERLIVAGGGGGASCGFYSIGGYGGGGASPNGGGGGGNGDCSTISYPSNGGIGGFGGPLSGILQYGLGGVNSNNCSGAGGGGGGWLGGGGGGDNETNYSETYQRGFDGTALGGGTAGGGENLTYNGKGGTADGLGGSGGGYDDYQGGTGGYNGGGGGANTDGGGGGGGGGYYGGGGAGGSGYVWTSATASNAPLGYLVSTTYYLNSAETIAGNESMPNPEG